MFDKPEICGECGGACCKHKPGYFWPEDIKGPCVKKTITDMLRSRKVILDWCPPKRPEWDNRDDDYYIKDVFVLSPNIISCDHVSPTHRDTVFVPLWSGQCIFLGMNGCVFPSEERPLQCKLLEPVENYPGGCIAHNEESTTKYDCAAAWAPYNDALKEIGEQVELDLKILDDLVPKPIEPLIMPSFAQVLTIPFHTQGEEDSILASIYSGWREIYWNTEG